MIAGSWKLWRGTGRGENAQLDQQNKFSFLNFPSPCLKIEDIFCFCVENLCGHQTIGWLVKFRGRTFESFFDINMRCIKIIILVLVWQSTKKHICIVSDKISEIDKHVVSWIVLLWLIDVLPHLDVIYSLQYRLDSNV